VTKQRINPPSVVTKCKPQSAPFDFAQGRLPAVSLVEPRALRSLRLKTSRDWVWRRSRILAS
jgi:hypothetical protein